MARCQCGAELTGRRRKCDACKRRPGQVVPSAADPKSPPKKAGKKTVVKRPAKKAAPRKAPAKKAPAERPAMDAAPVAEVPAGLHSRGQALWTALGQTLNTAAGQIALEACRSADRLDELDSVIAGKGVLKLMAFRLKLEEDLERDDLNLHVTVSFQNVLAEARQQQANFKALLAEISDTVPAAPKSPAASGPKKSPLDELAERRANKK